MKGSTQTQLAPRSRGARFREVWERFSHNKVAVVMLIILLVIILASCFADFLAPYDYAEQDYTAIFEYPSMDHWFGTDNLGRDIFSRVLKGGQITLLISLASVALGLVIGGTLGSIAAYVGGKFGNIVMRIMDIVMSVPGFLLAIAISAMLGTGLMNSIIAISLSSLPAFARIMYAAVLTVKGQEYIEAAVASGASDFRIIMKYVVPNTLAPLIVNSTLRIGNAILQISSLSFIGLGIQPPMAEWGSILSAGRKYIRDFYPIVIFPGIAIVVTMVVINILGDGLRDALDPRLKT